MKTTLGVGVSVLSALAAQGKDFDRTELDATLDMREAMSKENCGGIRRLAPRGA